MSRAKLSEELHKLLPGEKDKRFRAAVMLAYNGSSSIARGIKDQIDQENRLRKGLINSGTLTISSPTSATLDLFAWVIDYEIFQPGIITLSVIAPDASFPRIDVFHGNPEGQIIYAPGSIDAFGNSIFPDIPETNVILRQIIRNNDGTLVEIIIPQAAPFDHNGTANIQGGTPTERFHITRPQAAAMDAANNPSEDNPVATLEDLESIIASASAVPIRQVFIYSTSNTFSLSHSDPTAIYVVLNGQMLESGFLYDWNISGTTLTVTTPLTAGDEISILYYTALPTVTKYERNIDGGAPDSVYLSIQNVDGGTP